MGHGGYVGGIEKTKARWASRTVSGLLCGAAEKRHNVSPQSCGKSLKGQVSGWLGNISAFTVRCHQEASCVVKTLVDQATTEQSISLAIANAQESSGPVFGLRARLSPKCRIHGEIGLFIANGHFDIVAIFEQKEVTKKRCRGFSKPSLSKRRPYVVCASDRFFGAIVHIVAN
jgi:hypothetical protein